MLLLCKNRFDINLWWRHQSILNWTFPTNQSLSLTHYVNESNKIIKPLKVVTFMPNFTAWTSTKIVKIKTSNYIKHGTKVICCIYNRICRNEFQATFIERDCWRKTFTRSHRLCDNSIWNFFQTIGPMWTMTAVRTTQSIAFYLCLVPN